LHNSEVSGSFSSIYGKRKATSTEKVTNLHPAFPFFSLVSI